MYDIYTHNGLFHVSECIAIAILKIARAATGYSRVKNIKPTAYGIKINVGGVYNPEIYCFDCRQESFCEFRADGTSLATAGVIWKYYGKQALKNLHVPKEIWSQIDSIISDIDNVELGEIIEVQVSGIENYGIFVNLPNSCKGMIHISQISDKYVKDIYRIANVGDSRLTLISPEHIIRLSYDHRVTDEKERKRIWI